MNKYKIDYSCICPLEDIFYGSICIETELGYQKVLNETILNYNFQKLLGEAFYINKKNCLIF